MHALVRLLASSAALACLLAVGSAACGALDGEAPLFRDTTRQPAVAPPDAARLLRSRDVEVDFDALGGTNPRASAAPQTVLLNLFPDATYVAVRDSVAPTSAGRGVIWSGYLEGMAGSSVMLAVEDGVLAGTVAVGPRRYQVRYAGNGVHVVSEFDPGAFPRD